VLLLLLLLLLRQQTRHVHTPTFSEGCHALFRWLTSIDLFMSFCCRALMSVFTLTCLEHVIQGFTLISLTKICSTGLSCLQL
jgi:hypothetical protein